MSESAHTLPAALQDMLPAGYRLVHQRAVTIDGEPATLTRYQRADGRHTALGGEHISTVVDARQRLKGFADMAERRIGQPLPSRQQAEAAARRFLQRAAPDLLPTMRVHWIEPHDETLRLSDAGATTRTLTLSGMKVKAQNMADRRWFWVIVGADARPLVFERDIVWINFPGRRQTEKWLHDDWLAAQPPAAR